MSEVSLRTVQYEKKYINWGTWWEWEHWEEKWNQLEWTHFDHLRVDGRRGL